MEGKIIEMVDLKANEGKTTCSKDTGKKRLHAAGLVVIFSLFRHADKFYDGHPFMGNF